MKADRRAQDDRLRGMSLANLHREAKGGACPEWCLVKPTLASPIFFLRWVNTDEHEFYSEHFSQEFPYLDPRRKASAPNSLSNGK